MFIKKHPILGIIILVTGFNIFTSAVCFVSRKAKE